MRTRSRTLIFCICSGHGTCSPSGATSCTSSGFNYRCVAHRTGGSAADGFLGDWHGTCEQNVGLATMGSAASLICSTNSCGQEYNITYRNSSGTLETMYYSGGYAPGSMCSSAPGQCSARCRELVSIIDNRTVSTTSSSDSQSCLYSYFNVRLAAQASVKTSCADANASSTKAMSSDLQTVYSVGGLQVCI